MTLFIITIYKLVRLLPNLTNIHKQKIDANGDTHAVRLCPSQVQDEARCHHVQRG